MVKLQTKRLLVILFVAGALQSVAQQTGLFNTYVYDPLQLNIAYAGHACSEVNLHYRNQWIGMKQAPVFFQLNAHTALGKSNGIGLKVLSQQIGLLNNTQASFGYAYRFSVSKTADIHLGLGIGWTQSVFNAQKATVIDANDVTLAAGKQKANGFDSEFGAMYLGNKLKAGVAVQHIYNSNPGFAGSHYKLLPQSNVNVSYTFNKGKKVEVEPWLLDRYTFSGTHTVEGMLNLNILNTLTVGAGYRSNYGMLGFVGAKIGSLKIAYSFDYGVSKHATAVGSSHQVLLGFTMCRPPKAIVKNDQVVAPPAQAEHGTGDQMAKDETPPIKDTAVAQPLVAQEAAAEPPKNEQAIAELNKISREIIFELNSAELQDAVLKQVDSLALIIKAHPSLKVAIVGHSCNKGTDELNSTLSLRRAVYIKNILLKQGVKAEQIGKCTGIGAKEPLFDNDSKDQPRNRTIRFTAAR